MIRVAIIEDDPTMREALAAEIAAAEDMLLVQSASCCAEATGMIEAGGYDVLLCDLGMPDGDGIALIGQEAATGRDTDIIVITQFASHDRVLASIRAGARGYLLKEAAGVKCAQAIRDMRCGGSPITPLIARQLVSELVAPASPKPVVSPLSDREAEVLNILARGFSYAECAGVLKVSANTIGFHVKNIYRKLEVNSRAEALFEAASQGLFDRS